MNIESESFITDYIQNLMSIEYPGPYLGMLLENYNASQLFDIVEYLYGEILTKYNQSFSKRISDDMMISILNFNIYRIVLYLGSKANDFNWYNIYDTFSDIVENHIGIDLNPYETTSY